VKIKKIPASEQSSATHQHIRPEVEKAQREQV